MKISYSNYPILYKLLNGNLNGTPFFEQDKEFMLSHLSDNSEFSYFSNFIKYSDRFKSNINYVTNPFYEAFMKSQKKLLDLGNNIIENDIDDFTYAGTYIIGERVTMMLYESKKGSKDFNSVIYEFTKEGLPLLYFIHSNKLPYYLFWKSNSLQIDTDKPMRDFCDDYIGMFCQIEMFKKFSQIETKLINGNSKQTINRIKCVNDTRLPVTHLDSLWFTNLVKSEAFKVSGHFRWQNKKENGIWKKDLIWINDFEKSGYSRKATKCLNTTQPS